MNEEPKFNRRDFGKLAVGALAATVGVGNAEASPLETIERDKNAAIGKTFEKLLTPGNEEVLAHVSSYSFWGKRNAGIMPLHELRGEMRTESDMAVPSEEDVKALQQNFPGELSGLIARIQPGKNGLFLDGNDQSLFVIHKEDSGTLSFPKKYPVVTSHRDWSNENDSHGTPTGFNTVKEVRHGLFGEVVSTKNPHADDARYFKRMRVMDNGRSRVATFVKGVTLQAQPVPEVISTALLLDPARGIWIHGSPRKGLAAIPPEQRRNTAGSTGCVRASSIDVLDMTQYVAVGTPICIYGKNPVRPPNLNWFFRK